MNGTSGLAMPPRFERYFSVCATAVLIPLILAGNLLVMISYKKNRRLRTRTNTFLISLAMSDMIVGGVNLPMWVFCLVNYEVCISSPTYNLVFKFLDRFGAFASIFHLTAISVERYIAVVRPYLFYRLVERFFFTASGFAWITATLLASLSWLNHFHTKPYNMAVFIIGFAVPAIIVVSMYCGIFKSAKSLIKRTPAFQGTTTNNNHIIREDRKVAVTVAVISGMFIVAWLPFFLLSIIASYCPIHCLPKKPADVWRLVTVVKWLHYSNSSINPIVYAFRDKEWKKTFKNIFGFNNYKDMNNSPSTTDRALHANENQV